MHTAAAIRHHDRRKMEAIIINRRQNQPAIACPTAPFLQMVRPTPILRPNCIDGHPRLQTLSHNPRLDIIGVTTLPFRPYVHPVVSKKLPSQLPPRNTQPISTVCDIAGQEIIWKVRVWKPQFIELLSLSKLQSEVIHKMGLANPVSIAAV